jgi:hypothetical protein
MRLAEHMQMRATLLMLVHRPLGFCFRRWRANAIDAISREASRRRGASIFVRTLRPVRRAFNSWHQNGRQRAARYAQVGRVVHAMGHHLARRAWNAWLHGLETEDETRRHLAFAIREWHGAAVRSSWHTWCARVHEVARLRGVLRVLAQSSTAIVLRTWRHNATELADTARTHARGISLFFYDGRCLRHAWNTWSDLTQSINAIRKHVALLRRSAEGRCFHAWVRNAGHRRRCMRLSTTAREHEQRSSRSRATVRWREETHHTSRCRALTGRVIASVLARAIRLIRQHAKAAHTAKAAAKAAKAACEVAEAHAAAEAAQAAREAAEALAAASAAEAAEAKALAEAHVSVATLKSPSTDVAPDDPSWYDRGWSDRGLLDELRVSASGSSVGESSAWGHQPPAGSQPGASRLPRESPREPPYVSLASRPPAINPPPQRTPRRTSEHEGTPTTAEAEFTRVRDAAGHDERVDGDFSLSYPLFVHPLTFGSMLGPAKLPRLRGCGHRHSTPDTAPAA